MVLLLQGISGVIAAIIDLHCLLKLFSLPVRELTSSFTFADRPIAIGIGPRRYEFSPLSAP